MYKLHTLVIEANSKNLTIQKIYAIINMLLKKGGNIVHMLKENSKASITIKRIIAVILIFSFLMGIGVMAANTKVNSVTIILANGYEMEIVTSKTNIKEILEENHILLQENEEVTPKMEEQLTENNTIRISTQEEAVIAESQQEVVTVETLLANYESITEKMVTVQEEIPFETVTKDVATTSGTKQEKVVQEGQNGIKEVTYKIRYQNETEIDRKEIASTILKEPVEKIIEVRTQQVTSRSSVDRGSTSVSYSNGVWSYSASEFDLLCAITAQECSSSYEGALAVITCACNRAESSKWRSRGTDPLSQYKAQGQFCYSIDNHWRKRLNGNYSSIVSQAVQDALNGKRNHNFLSFRASGYANGTKIGGNVYFNPM